METVKTNFSSLNSNAANERLLLSIILPTKDRQPLLFKTLKALLTATENIDCEILIIDNSTSADIQLPTTLQHNSIKIVKNPGNRNSVFASRNYGASIAQSEQLLFLDDDILVTPESIHFAIEFQRQHPRTASNVSWQYPPELLDKMKSTVFGRFLIYAGYTTMRELYGVEQWQTNAIFESKGVASYFLCIQRQTFREVGAYEERHLHEGTDMSLIENLRRSNVKMYINSQLLIFHNEEDRVEIRNWMERKKRLGEIIAHSVAIGDASEKKLNYSLSKTILFRFTFFLRSPLILFMTKILPRVEVLDKFRFKFISLITVAYMHHGYKSEVKRNKLKT